MTWSRDGDAFSPSSSAPSAAAGGRCRQLRCRGRQVGGDPGHRTRSVSFSADGRFLATTRWAYESVDPHADARDHLGLGTRRGRGRMDTSARAGRVRPDGRPDRDQPRPSRGSPTSGTRGRASGWRPSPRPPHVMDIAFEPPGRRLATAHADGTIRLWDPETGVQSSCSTLTTTKSPQRGVQPGRLHAGVDRR